VTERARVLLDECVPRRLRRELSGLDVSTVPDEGWASRRNGDLLRLMLGAGFTVFVTMDRNLSYQQNVAGAGVAVVVLRARTNRLMDLLPLVGALREAIGTALPGQVVHIAR
jgi:hypothetical protein